ncbi:ABC transporter substrate-binding protein [Futiania mangrovi]|uniref:ABC transporter substrate-binding protein n=1 Tax=Futiania mangrovi TaxID=2959716 RepID=A0A9J6PGM3_9PROT|nr:ABC transporter substrate-binding protein [Futiania mangrovii]MCP1336976.1 ABC transporter substrate-binding protein [Futiania mangrovii]
MSIFATFGKAACVAAALALGGAGAMTASAPRADAAEVTVTHWGVLMYGAPYAVAMEKGFFKEAGVDVTGVLTSKGGGTTMRNVMAADLPYGEVALSAVVAAINQGADLKIVNTGVQTVGEILWVTLPDSPIKTTKDLDGKKVSFTSPKSVTEMLLTMVSDANGIKPDMVAAGGIGAGLTLLKEGAVVAAPIMDPIWAKLSDNYRPVFQVADELPQMIQSVGVTTSEFLKENPDTIRALVEGRRKGVDFVYANPEEAAQIVAKYYEMDPALALKAINNLIKLNYWSRGEFNLEAMDRLIGGLRIIGEVEGKVDWAKYVDDSFVK